MKLEDLNQTEFLQLSPEIQTQLIEAQSTDPLVIMIVLWFFIFPLLFMR